MSKTINLTAPTAWNELTVPQLFMVAEVLYSTLTREERLILLFCRLTGVKLKMDGDAARMLHEGKWYKLELYELADFSERFAWLLEMEPDCLPNPTQKDEYLRDFSFGDYYETDTLFRVYASDGDLSHFDIILPKLGQDVRPLTESEAWVYQMWWAMATNNLVLMYPNVLDQKDASTEYNPFKTLQDIHLLLNDDRPQENERIDDANLHDVLSALDSRIEKLKQKTAP